MTINMTKKRKYTAIETDVAAKVCKSNNLDNESSHVKRQRHGEHQNLSAGKRNDKSRMSKRHTADITSSGSGNEITHRKSGNNLQNKRVKLSMNSSHDEENTKGKNEDNLIKGGNIISQRKPGSCMKHKKQDKVPHMKKLHKKCKKSKKQSSLKHAIDREAAGVLDKGHAGVSDKGQSAAGRVSFPQSSQDVSTNWKDLQKKFHIKDKKKKGNEGKRSTADTMLTPPDAPKAKPDIWFDDVDEVLIEASKTKHKSGNESRGIQESSKNPLVKSNSFSGLTKTIAMDCEMVGTGSDGVDSILARVSIVNQYGQCIYDKLVQATDKVTDYRTQFSGIRPGDLVKGEEYKVVQKDVHDMIKGRVLVGHAIHNDLKVLFLDHPRKAIRDTSKYKPFRKLFQGKTPSLKKLSDQVLGVKIQEAEHNSIQDAQAAMRLYTMYRKSWEKDIRLRGKLHAHKQSTTTKTKTDDNMATLDSDNSD